MPEESNPALDLSASKQQAEVLEWMGSAYGRPEDAAPSPRAARFSSLLKLAPWAKATLARRKRAALGTLVLLLATVSTFALLRAWGPWSNGAAEIPRTPQADIVSEAQTAGDTVAENRAARTDAEQTRQEAEVQRSSESEAPVAPEGKVAEVAPPLTRETPAGESAERSSAEPTVQLEAEGKARAEWETVTVAAREAADDTRPETTAAPVSAAPAPAPEPKPEPAVPARDPVEQAAAPPQVTQQVVTAKPADPSLSQEKMESVATVWAGGEAIPAEAKSEFLKGEEHFAKGDIAAARRHFERAAALGMTEGALALGNTYDPVSLAKAGLKLTGDPHRARQWYRRAYELAQRQR